MNDPAFSTEHIQRLLDPSGWAHSVLEASKAGWPLSSTSTEVALRLTGDITEAERVAADLECSRMRNSGDLMRHEGQRALDLQIQLEDTLH